MIDQEDKLNGVIEWVKEESPDSFDPSFIYSLQDQFSRNGKLTERQDEALDNIIKRYHISEYYF